jgi:uncharacterized phage-like protein YoqJ
MIVAGTGHRPNKVGGYSEDATGNLVIIARNWLKRNVDHRDEVITGMAQGWDQALGWAAYDLGIPFIAAVPFAGQESAWPSVSQGYYNDLLKLASQVHIVSEGGYAPWKMQVRNEWMVDRCDTVLALWDGSSGGTGNCIKYAEKVGKPIVNLWEAYEKL